MSEQDKEESQDTFDHVEDTNIGTEEGTEANNDNVSEDETVEEPATPEDLYNELNNKYVRLYSDFDNFRKRTIKEKADIISTASGSVISDLLVVLDDFERAISNNEKVEDVDSLREGFTLIYNKLFAVLKSKGLEVLESKGDVFDTDRHEAITNIPVQNEADKGKIVDVIEKGYNLRGSTLRYAKVIVGQ